ncbi:Hypothetical Protein XCAW_02747 [Xanthomonas citri subsp. citri Aw12879]|nr:Hypothetical Protein XCAW_02747 [Xanthomonas citri subsp. citri Aw12879]
MPIKTRVYGCLNYVIVCQKAERQWFMTAPRADPNP